MIFICKYKKLEFDNCDFYHIFTYILCITEWHHKGSRSSIPGVQPLVLVLENVQKKCLRKMWIFRNMKQNVKKMGFWWPRKFKLLKFISTFSKIVEIKNEILMSSKILNKISIWKCSYFEKFCHFLFLNHKKKKNYNNKA